jgi:hypothetical protein
MTQEVNPSSELRTDPNLGRQAVHVGSSLLLLITSIVVLIFVVQNDHNATKLSSIGAITTTTRDPNVPVTAQSSGSFSVWSDPADPAPGRDYFIVVRVRLPNSVVEYPASDLTGMIMGSDHYRQEIRFKDDEHYPVEGGAAQVRIRVPGAAKMIEDDIIINSKMLRERQEFQIAF